MTKILELLGSRKFWLMVSAVATTAVSWYKGAVGPDVAIGAIVAAVSVWVNSQGKVDAANKMTPLSKPDVRE